jgi:hypothetical protein
LNPLAYLRRLQRIIDRVPSLARAVDRTEASLAQLREAVGRIEARQSTQIDSWDLADHEFRVFSQWGEDGILDFLTRVVPVPRPVFVEFGVETYAEANTRFLLSHRGWSGLVLDGSEEHLAALRRDPIFWRHHLKAATAFITRENINELISAQGLSGPIGLLSVDIDGNDYWVWEAITVIEPAIVVVEYNALFGSERAVTIPYQPEFSRAASHWSHLYAGASLPALAELGRKKGYAFVGTNRAGNNAFFVREEVRPAALRSLTVAEGYRPAQYREARNEKGELAFYTPAEAEALIADLPLVEVK